MTPTALLSEFRSCLSFLYDGYLFLRIFLFESYKIEWYSSLNNVLSARGFLFLKPGRFQWYLPYPHWHKTFILIWFTYNFSFFSRRGISSEEISHDLESFTEHIIFFYIILNLNIFVYFINFYHQFIIFINRFVDKLGVTSFFEEFHFTRSSTSLM